MAGTLQGGRNAARTNLAKDPDFYRKIGAVGGRNGNTGGFAKMNPCDCNGFPGKHHKAQCAGLKGGRTSRRRKPESVAGGGLK